jgi:hypothetical protein
MKVPALKTLKTFRKVLVLGNKSGASQHAGKIDKTGRKTCPADPGMPISAAILL